MHLKKLSKPNQKCHIEYNSFKNANNICHKNSCNTVPDISKIFLNNYSTKGERITEEDYLLFKIFVTIIVMYSLMLRFRIISFYPNL